MEFDNYAAKYDDGFMGKGSGRFYKNLIKEIEINDGETILDAGCGTGTILNYISKKKKINGFGIDVSESMIKEAYKKTQAALFQLEMPETFLLKMIPLM